MPTQSYAATVGSADLAIGELADMLAELDKLRAELATECEQATSVWSRLSTTGGYRADHAASLLANTLPHLRRLESFASVCREQMEWVVANPFGKPE